MKRTFTTLALVLGTSAAFAQSQLINGGFEVWGNAAPGVADEPAGFYSNKSGSSTAQLGPQTCFKDTLIRHSGNAAVRIESRTVPVFNTVVNGNLTTGIVNAPSTSKTDGYIGTVNYSAQTDVRRTAFTARPDSLVGWYQYTAANANEAGKVKAILHTDQYYDPETATNYHPSSAANKVAVAEFFTPAATVTTWTRFSVPFVYSGSSAPAYIMINATSSADQLTTVAGSKLWLDDLAVVYNSASHVGHTTLNNNARIWCTGHTLYADFLVRSNEQYSLELLDMSGRTVRRERITGNGISTFDLAALANGSYTYRLTGTHTIAAGRLAVQP